MSRVASPRGTDVAPPPAITSFTTGTVWAVELRGLPVLISVMLGVADYLDELVDAGQSRADFVR